MSKSNTLFSIFFFPLTLAFLLSFFVSFAAAIEQPSFYQSISPTFLGLHKEKLSHLHFFLHDALTGPKTTSVRVAETPVTGDTTLVRFVDVADYRLTMGKDPASKLVGKALGIYAVASSLEEAGLLTVLNLVFTEGKFNGSTLSLLGRETIYSSTTANVREIPIVGGSGALRFARGYAKVKPLELSKGDGLDAVEEYNVYVFHY